METPPAFDSEVINAIFKNVWTKSFKEKKDEVDGVEVGVSSTSKRNRLITAKPDALKLSCQLLQEFVTGMQSTVKKNCKAQGKKRSIVSITFHGKKNDEFKILTQKEIYAQLCSPKVFDESTKIFYLEKKKGEVCMSISAKALSITGIDDRRYWNYIANDDSRFNTVAYLQQTWWFQVDGEIDFCFPAGTYSLFYRVFLGRPSKRFGWRICDTSHVHGWDKKPVRFELSTSSGQQAIKQCYLEQQGYWLHYHVGDFSVEDSNIPTKVKFSMMQIDCTHTKGGLCMDSVLIYPKGYTRPTKPFAR